MSKRAPRSARQRRPRAHADARTSQPIQWGQVLLGVLLGIGSVFFFQEKPIPSTLVALEVTASQELRRIGGRARNSRVYALRTKGYPCSFGIHTAGVHAAGREKLEEIRAGDRLEVRISDERLVDLSQADQEIPVYSLTRNGVDLFDTEGYQAWEDRIDRRLGGFVLSFGLCLVLWGGGLVSRKKALVFTVVAAGSWFFLVWWGVL